MAEPLLEVPHPSDALASPRRHSTKDKKSKKKSHKKHRSHGEEKGGSEKRRSHKHRHRTAVDADDSFSLTHEEAEALLAALLEPRHRGFVGSVLVSPLKHERGQHDVAFAVMMRAIESGEDDVALALIELGTDPNAIRADGYTPAHLAAHLGNNELLRSLIELGADIAVRIDPLGTPLDVARAAGHQLTVRFLTVQMMTLQS